MKLQIIFSSLALPWSPFLFWYWNILYFNENSGHCVGPVLAIFTVCMQHRILLFVSIFTYLSWKLYHFNICSFSYADKTTIWLFYFFLCPFRCYVKLIYFDHEFFFFFLKLNLVSNSGHGKCFCNETIANE